MPATIPLHAAKEVVYRTLTHRNFRRIEECSTLIDWLEPGPGERILDVGCGDGFYDYEIAARGAAVVGIDIDTARLAIAQARNRSPRTEFHYMDAEEMSFPDRSFDKAISFCVIEHFRRDERVLAHLGRVLRPGGLLVLSADSLSNAGITEAEREMHRRRYAVNTFYTVDSLRQKLDAAGFDLLETRYILTAPLTLALTRFSWWLDELPPSLSLVGELGYQLLGTVGKLLSDAAERLSPRPEAGLTLLARARRRA